MTKFNKWPIFMPGVSVQLFAGKCNLKIVGS